LWLDDYEDQVQPLPELESYWVGDLGFQDHQLDSWRRAEGLAGISNPKDPEKAAAKKKAAAKSNSSKLQERPSDFNGTNFFPMKKFEGPIAGFVFRTDELGTGYYRDIACAGGVVRRKQSSAIPILLDELIKLGDCSEVLMQCNVGDGSFAMPRSKRARRARQPDGKRKKRVSRRSAANKRWREGEGNDLCCPEVGSIRDRWWKECGMWAIETGNPNSWKSGCDAALKRSNADVLALQEARISSLERLDAAANEARRLGWNPVLSPALKAGGNMNSGGGAILARKGTGVKKMCQDSIPESMGHRLACTWVDCIIKGGVHFLNVYLKDSEGLSATNKLLLETAAGALNGLKGPWIAQGDWNLPPETLAASKWLDMVNGVIFATQLPTCNESVYDYFVVHKSLADAVIGVQRLQDVGLNPHWMSRLILKGNAKRFAVRQLVRPAKVEGILPHGPPQQPPDYQPVLDKLAKDQPDEGARCWVKLARQEWSKIAGEDLQFTECRFKWASAVNRAASPWDGSTTTSVAWRTLARRAGDITRLLARVPWHKAHIAAVTDHLLAAGKASASLPNAMRQLHGQQLDAWAASFNSAINVCSVHWLQSLAKLADVKATALEKETCRCRLHEWQVAIGAKPAAGNFKPAAPSKLAFRWMRGPIGWQVSPNGPAHLNECIPAEPDGDTTLWVEDEPFVVPRGEEEDVEMAILADQAAVEHEANQWGSLWRENGNYKSPVGPPPDEHFLPLMPMAIGDAADSFPINTALGCDNVAPRAYSRLSEAAIRVLIVLFMTFEKKGQWAEVVNLVIIVLLPKKTGGRRPIGLFPTMVRIWMRARIIVARVWEAANAMPTVFGGAGMGAQKAAWQAAFDSESAALTGTSHAQSLLDLVKAFETVPHEVLASAAEKAGYNMVILRLSLAAYRLLRVLSIEGVFSRKIRATRGITAGSGFATGELKVLLLGLMRALQVFWSERLNCKLFVDDLTLAASGQPAQLVQLMITVNDFVVQWLEQRLKMQVSDTKSKVIASTPKIAQAIVDGSTNGKVKVATITQLLGTDTAGSRQRRTQSQQQRFANYRSCKHRLRSLRQAGVNSLQMVRAAGPPAFLYGVETIGVSDSTLTNMRSSVASDVTHDAGGKNPDIALLACDGPAGKVDPAFLAHSYPVQYWALAWWEKWFTPEQLQHTFAEAAVKLDKAKASWWSVVAGPVTALLATLQRLGWSMPSASEAIDDLGSSWIFGLDSPAAIVKACDSSVRRWRLNRICKALPGLDPGRTELPHCSGNQALLIDFVAALHPALKGKRFTPPDGCTWDSKWAPSLASAMTGGQWPQARKAQVASFKVTSNLCQLCFREVGTLQHRARCSATLPTGGWPQPPQAAALARRNLSVARERLLETRGLLTVRVPAPVARHDGCFEWLLMPDLNNPAVDEATWYFDGSMLDGKVDLLRATGFGITVTSPAGDLLGTARGNPPQWCSTAAAAEAWALLEVLRQTHTPPKMRTDCLSLVKTAKLGAEAATAPSRQLARIWVCVANILDGDLTALERTNLLVWQPAHQTVQAIGQRHGSDGKKITTIDWRANRLADALAKQAAEQVRATKEARDLVQSCREAVRHAACGLGQVTFAANNHKAERVGEDGKLHTVTFRDSQEAPKKLQQVSSSEKLAKRASKAVAAKTAKQAKKAVRPLDIHRLHCQEPPSKKRLTEAHYRAERAEACRAALKRNLEDRASSLTRSATVTAPSRLEQMRKRVRLRLTESAPGGAAEGACAESRYGESAA